MTSMSALSATTLPTPVGALSVLVGPDGVVRAAGFAPVAAMAVRLRAGVDAGLWSVREVPERDAAGDAALAVAVDAVRAYSDGEPRALDSIRVLQPGGPFFQEVWEAMRRIPAGKTVSYAELAASAGRPAAVRAAGTACARNLVAPFVPCHRVVRTGGALGAYFYGLDVKRALLALEARG